MLILITADSNNNNNNNKTLLIFQAFSNLHFGIKFYFGKYGYFLMCFWDVQKLSKIE